MGIRSLALITAGLLVPLLPGCGGGPDERATAASRPSPPDLPGAPVDVAIWFALQPTAFEAALDAFEQRLGDDPAGQLGPAGAAWARARAALADRLGDLAPAAGEAGDAWAAWGLDPAAPIRVALAAPEGPALGRALVARLQGRAQPRPAVLMRARAVARVADGQRLAAGLDGVAKRLGLAIEPRGGDRWRAYDPESGARAVLRLVGEHAVLDVALPSAPGERVEAVPPDEVPWPAVPPAPISAGVRPAGLAALEAAIGGSAALAGVAEREAASALPVLIAAAEVMAACTARWSAAAALVDEITATIDAPDGRPRLLGEARLTERGAAAWTATRTAPPLRSLDELPVVAQAAVDPAAFRAAGGIEADWWDETSACAAGAAAGAVVAGIWPALAERLPVPAPPGGWTAPARGLAAALTGANAVEGAAVPALAGVWIVDAETPHATAPLGPGGEAVQPGVWASADGVPVVFADRAVGQRRALVMAIGGGAWTAIEPRLASDSTAPEDTAPDPAPLLDIRLDPHRLASALTHAGERGAGVAALVALGERFGRWRLHVEHAGRAVRWTLDARAEPPMLELDRPPAPK